MKVALHQWKDNKMHHYTTNDVLDFNKTGLVLGFGEKSLLENNKIYQDLRQLYPNASIVTCSTSGEIFGESVEDHTISITAIEFEKTRIAASLINIRDFSDSFAAGESLVANLDQEDLQYILVISDGNKVNGSELVKGMNSKHNKEILITGGLAGDAANFNSTLVGLNDNIDNGNIVAVAFYGTQLQVSHGCMGGWDMFGPEKRITKSEANVLYEIDGKNALDLYKEYLGKFAAELPSSALLFPLSVELDDEKTTVVRTILSIDEEKNTMTFAGDVPVNSKIRFMRANFDRIINAASVAAQQSELSKLSKYPKLALLISCVGRKLILKNRTVEEVEAINDTFHKQTFLSGFYSYGEISPLLNNSKCELHNQTMTITTFNECG